MVKFGNSDYYVISEHNSSKDYITLLKDVPLTYDEVTQIVEENNFKINEYTSVTPGKVYNYKWSDYMGNIYGGYGGTTYYTSSSCGYVNNKRVKSGCTNDYEKSYIKKILDEWIKNLPEGLKEINGYKVRLITLDELRKFGIEEQSTDTTGYRHSNSSVPNWLNLNHWYWSMTPADDSDINVWIVNGGSGMKSFPVCSDGVFQTSYLLGLIRPVINVSTDMLNK